MRLSPLLLPAFCVLLLCDRPARGEAIFSLRHDFVVEAPPARPPMQLVDNPYRLTVYLNFDGAPITGGGDDDARANHTTLILSTLDYPAMANWTRLGGRDKGIADILAEVKLLFSKVAVEFVTTRPASGDYTMALIGGVGEGAAGGGDAVGISPLDCKNSNPNDIVLIFGDKFDGTAKQIAMVIAHELGHSFGLEHVEDQTSIMFPALNDQTCCWTTSTVEPPSICGRAQQDDEAVLLAALGGGPGDAVTPLCWFLRPGAGAVLPSSFSAAAAAIDDLRVHHVTFYLDGVKQAEVDAEPFATFFSQVPDGEHLLEAEAADWKPNLASAEIKITVDAGCALKGTCTGGAAAVSEACSKSAECSSGICALQAGVGRCTLSCDPTGNLCPTGSSCQASGAASICTDGPGWTVEEPAQPSGGGCAVDSGRGNDATGGAGLALLLGVAVLLGKAGALSSRTPRAESAKHRHRR